MADTETTDDHLPLDENVANCSQTEINIEEEDNLDDAYRSGHFGERRGKLNFKLAQRWSIVHVFVATMMTCLALTCVILIENHSYQFSVDRNLIDAFWGIVIVNGVTGTATALSSLYLTRRLSKLRRPLLVLLIIRLMAFAECILVHGGIIILLAIVGSSREVVPISDELRTFRVLCVFLVIVMILDWIAAMIWLFHWWRCCPLLECLKSLAVYEPGGPLRDGYPDPPSGLIVECAEVCSGICTGTDRYGVLL